MFRLVEQLRRTAEVGRDPVQAPLTGGSGGEDCKALARKVALAMSPGPRFRTKVLASAAVITLSSRASFQM